MANKTDGIVTSSIDGDIAPMDTGWDGVEARQEIQELTDASPDNPNPDFDSAFLWRPADSDDISERKFLFKRAVDGELKIVPEAVFAIAATLRGTSSDPDIPSEDKQQVWERVRELYSQLREEFDDFDRELPQRVEDSIIVSSSSYMDSVCEKVEGSLDLTPGVAESIMKSN